MDFTTYQKLALRTESHPRLPRITHSLMWMVTEVAEMMDNLKKHVNYNQPIDYANLKEELWDLMRYIAAFCDATGISLDEAMEANIEKLKIRYPDGFSDIKAEKRDKDDEMRVMVQWEPAKDISKKKVYARQNIPGLENIAKYPPDLTETKTEEIKTNTIIYRLSQLPDWYRERAINNVKIWSLNDFAPDTKTALFLWIYPKHTEEWEDFWSKVYDAYRDWDLTKLPSLDLLLP